MIDKICARLEEASFLADETFDEDGYSNDDGIEVVNLETAKEIVQETAKEYDNGWIPVETELPKEHLWAGHVKSEDVFVTFLDNGGKARVDTDNTYDGKWRYYGDRVIAWMPKNLPAPYQKGEKNVISK